MLTFRAKEYDEFDHVSDFINFCYDEHRWHLIEQMVTKVDCFKVS